MERVEREKRGIEVEKAREWFKFSAQDSWMATKKRNSLLTYSRNVPTSLIIFKWRIYFQQLGSIKIFEPPKITVLGWNDMEYIEYNMTLPKRGSWCHQASLTHILLWEKWKKLKSNWSVKLAKNLLFPTSWFFFGKTLIIPSHTHSSQCTTLSAYIRCKSLIFSSIFYQQMQSFVCLYSWRSAT